ncbi:hypothetical protein PVK06_004182 [Gossypium arboreum]|uniref:Uncharacterized protein n=1 Tax=Gossypium arboreum TaxID=29729 RepID=A0ABR0QRA0_GOSAR|nr:hypothetical protein PVK06_004182 [Gossypium arboreum]
MAVNQTAALKVGLCLLGLCLFGYIMGPPLYWHFMEGLVAFSHTSNTCPPYLCDCSSQPLLTIPEEDASIVVLLICCLFSVVDDEELSIFFYSAYKYGQAIDLYTQTIELNSQNAVYWANRSLAHTKLEEYGSAIQDATKAIEVDPKYLKACFIY